MCKRTTNDGECATEIPLLKENLKVMRPDVPLLCAICPSCGQSHILKKDMSKILADQFFTEEIADGIKKPAKQVQKDDEGTPDDFRPSSKLAASVASTMNLLGYKGEKWKEKINAITEMVRSVPSYQNAQGMYGLLAGWGVDSQHIQMIIQRTFSMNADSQGPFPPNITVMPQNYPQQPVFGQQQASGQPTFMQTPGGGIVIVPQQQNLPPSMHEIPDTGETVEEILGKDGKVAKRIIRRSSRAGSEISSPTAAMVEMITALKDLGVIGQRAEAAAPISPEMRVMADAMLKLTEIVTQVKKDVDGSREGAVSTKTEQMIERLQEKIDSLEEDKYASQVADLKSELESVRRDARESRDHSPRSGESFEHTKAKLQHETIESLGDRAETIAVKALDPLIKMQEMQMKMNAVMMLRGMEQQDGVLPGTYINTIRDATTAPEPSDNEVQSQKDRWKQKVRDAKDRTSKAKGAGDKK